MVRTVSSRVRAPTATPPGGAAACRRAAALTASPVRKPWPDAGSTSRRTSASPVSMPICTCSGVPSNRFRPATAPTRRRPARTARSASSSWTVGTPKTPTTPSPMDFSTMPPCDSITLRARSAVLGEQAVDIFRVDGLAHGGEAYDVADQGRDDLALPARSWSSRGGRAHVARGGRAPWRPARLRLLRVARPRQRLHGLHKPLGVALSQIGERVHPVLPGEVVLERLRGFHILDTQRKDGKTARQGPVHLALDLHRSVGGRGEDQHEDPRLADGVDDGLGVARAGDHVAGRDPAGDVGGLERSAHGFRRRPVGRFVADEDTVRHGPAYGRVTRTQRMGVPPSAA